MTSLEGTPTYVPNPFYAALTTVEAPFAMVHGLARRFQPDVIPFAALETPSAQAFADLLTLLSPGEEVYITADEGETIAPVQGLAFKETLPGLQMRLAAPLPQEGPDPMVVALESEHIPEMLELKARAFPGFFGPRAAELGRFFGVRDPETGRLIAMGGERLATPSDREVSAVCTDPAFVGQGHAARIVRTVLQHQAQSGVGSMLHVTATNTRAIALYRRLGLRVTGPIRLVRLQRV